MRIVYILLVALMPHAFLACSSAWAQRSNPVMAYEGFDYFNTSTQALLQVYEYSNIPSAANIKGAVGGWAGDWTVARRSNGNVNGTIPGYSVSTVSSPGYTDGTYDLITSGTTAQGGRGDADIVAGRRLQTSTGGPFGCSSSGASLATNFLVANCPTASPTTMPPNNGNVTASRIGRPGTTVWVSLLARKQSTSGAFVFAFHDNTSNIVDYDDASGTGTYLALTTNTVLGVPIWTVRNRTTVAASTTPVGAANWTLLVMSLTFNGTAGSAPTSARIDLYVNPPLGTATPPALPNATLTTGAGDYAFNSIAYSDATISDSGIDEIRFGESFAAVTPASNKIKVVGGLCTGSLTNNIFTNGDFGGITGTNEQLATVSDYTNPTAVTFKRNTAPWNALAPGYSYVFNTNDTPNDGAYTILTQVRSPWNAVAPGVPVWLTTPDKSGTGFQMLVNAGYAPGLFYEQTPPNSFCENVRYEFSVEVFNVDNDDLSSMTNPTGTQTGVRCDPTTEPGCQQMSGRNASATNWMGAATNNCSGCNRYRILPDIEFLIDDVVVYSPPGPVPNDAVWHKYGFSFITKTGASNLKLGIRNKAPGGSGNDLSLDNFSFTPCVATLSLNNNFPNCSPTPQIQVSATNEFNTPVYQWQYRRGAGAWTDISGATSATYTVASPVIQNDNLRVLVANSTSVMTSRTTNCMAISGNTTANCITPLPVSLLSFKAEKTATGVQLNWQTVSEKEAASFTVERSADGIHFEPVCTVTAQGTTSSLHSYYCMDTHPQEGTTYYRLRQTDLDGQFTYSSMIQIHYGADTSHLITLVPNPTKDKVSVVFETAADKATIRLTTLLGQIIRQETVSLEGNKKIDLQTDSLADGIYLVEVVTSQQTFIQKLIIQR